MTYPLSAQRQSPFMQVAQEVYQGSVSACAAVPVMQLPLYLKITSQARAAYAQALAKGHSATPVHYSINPRVWYRGVGVLAGSFAPTIALQTTAKKVFSSVMDPGAASVCAGVASALVVCPAELVMNQQQKTGASFIKTAAFVHSHYGMKGFFRGLAATAAREGGFAGGYLGASPYLRDKFQEQGYSKEESQLYAGILAGIGAAVPTHPFDTLKTQVQRDLSLRDPQLQSLVKKGAFAGLQWRAVVCIVAATIMPYVADQLAPKEAK